MKYNFDELHSVLARRRITLRSEDGSDKAFDAGFGARLAAYFQAEQAAKSVTYPVTLRFDGLDGTFDGLVTIDREGWLGVQFDR